MSAVLVTAASLQLSAPLLHNHLPSNILYISFTNVEKLIILSPLISENILVAWLQHQVSVVRQSSAHDDTNKPPSFCCVPAHMICTNASHQKYKQENPSIRF